MTEIKENYKLNFFNFSRGEKIIYNIHLSNENINNLIEIFQKYSNSK